MMQIDNIIETLKKILADQLSADLDIITEDTDIINDLGADSLDIAEILMGVEQDFGLVIADDALENVKTVGELAAIIERQLK
ncbi:MAG: acyl carrier protein [Oscillospiraceae bacterium]|jgi:acyl carrier protein|nr:acyl carrier protein [Oscillospiraceae bacterium]